MVASHRSQLQRSNRLAPDLDGPAHVAPPADVASRRRGLYLAVDNTRPPADARFVGSWAGVEITARRWWQRLANRFGHYGLVDEMIGALPAVALAAAVVFGGLAFVLVAQGEPGSTSSGPPAAASTGAVVGAGDSVTSVASIIVVSPGESLWSIALDRFPEHDTRKVVDLLVEANGGSVIQAGQQLVVPLELQATS